MKEIIEKLNEQIEVQRERATRYEEYRDNCAKGSARWRELNEIADRYKCTILGIEIAIATIERENAKNDTK